MRKFAFFPYLIFVLLLAALGVVIFFLSSSDKSVNEEIEVTEAVLTEEPVKPEEPAGWTLAAPEGTKEEKTPEPEVPENSLPEISLTKKTETAILINEPVQTPAVTIPEPLTEAFPIVLPPLEFAIGVSSEKKELPILSIQPIVEIKEEPVKKDAAVPVLPQSVKETKPDDWVSFNYYYRLSQSNDGLQWDVVLVPVNPKNTPAPVFVPVIPFFPAVSVFYPYHYQVIDFSYSWTSYYWTSYYK